MSDYPDPDEEYELMYADELEMLRDQHDDEEAIVHPKVLPAKRSLDFTSPASRKPAKDDITLSQSIQPLPSSQEYTNHQKNTFNDTSINRKVNDNTFNDISISSKVNDITSTPKATSDRPERVLERIPETSNESSATNKRTVTDLFGDIEDIDFDDIELPSKRVKTEEEIDMELINRIIEERKLRQALAKPKSSNLRVNKHAYNVKDNMSLDIPSWPFMPLTNSDGDRVYVKLESEDTWDQSLETMTGGISLQNMYAGAWEEARKYLEAKETQSHQTQVQSQQPTAPVVNDSLWVDKYRPQSYVELLSEEPVNRAILHWLHLWDKIVFKKEVKTREPQQRTAFSKRTGQFQLSSKWKGKREAEAELGADGRPHYKVALLCGPPGVGKTTLAHLLAKLAGYRPVELNASDERSTDAFRNALQSATLMRSVLDADRRPNCLILDEIDGAPLPTVELLVKWCTATIETGKKKGKTHPLRRPVIAICNDLYAPALRPLRAVSLITFVSGPIPARVCSRLQAVGAAEGVDAAPRVWAALATRAKGDVRSAILLLSFVKANNKRQLTMEDVMNSAIGTKDCNKSVMQALQDVFTVNDSDPGAIMKTIQAAGDYERLADGIFENFLTCRVDSRLHIANETLSWLCFFDLINSWTMRSQNYSMYGALPVCIARCHQILASRTPVRVKFPLQAQEMYRKQQELESIAGGVSGGSWCGRAALRRDVLPMLPHILGLRLRSANVQLCSETERKALRTCAGALCDYGLQYVQQRAADGLYTTVLEPDIYKFAFFGNEEKYRPPPAIRQAISREQQLEMIRRNEEMANRVSNKNNSKEVTKDSKDSKTSSKEVQKENQKESRLPNHLQRLKPKEVEKTEPQVHKDFFGRIVSLSQVQRSEALPDVISSSSVFYQYREGFNNAVRRNVRTKDLL